MMKFVKTFISVAFALCVINTTANGTDAKTRVIVTSDGEVDDECSMVRFLLYVNEWDVEGIITTSSQYHWQGYHWAGDDWIQPYLEAYADVYPNLVLHDPDYPTPAFLQSRTFLGNVKTEGEMEEITPGSQHIVKVLLDDSDPRPIWIQAWGGINTIARALKTIEEQHPQRMEEVAGKIRFFFIWEQDSTYQDYIRPTWGKYGILTIISDQFEAIAYRWKNIQPLELQPYFAAPWMSENILNNHGSLCSLYKAHATAENGFDIGDFRSEGDSPAFIHNIPTGLRNMESPDWGGWAGRYINIRDNTWLDPVPDQDYVYPEGRYDTSTAWGRNSSRQGNSSFNNPEHREYFRPTWRWSAALQNDFAARSDWCVQCFEGANHAPIVTLATPLNLKGKACDTIKLSAAGTTDPDGDELDFKWWQYTEADSYNGTIEITRADQQEAMIKIPEDAITGETIHIICEVTDSGVPALTRYQRVVIEIVE